MDNKKQIKKIIEAVRVYHSFAVMEGYKMKDFRDLTGEELVFVYEANYQLQSDVMDDLYDSNLSFCGEILDSFERGALNYSISGYNDYMRVNNEEKFIDGCIMAQKKFCVFNEDDEKNVDYVRQLLEKRDNLYWYYNSYDKNYDLITARIKELCEEISDSLFDYLECIMNDSDDLEYWLDFYYDARMDGNYYVDDDYILYDHIEYKKKYA